MKVLGAFLLLWLLMGGLNVDKREEFTSDKFRLVADIAGIDSVNGVAGFASFRPHKTVFRIPLLFTYSQMSPPYTLLFQLIDSDVRTLGHVIAQFWKMEVTDALVEYTDAQTYRKPGRLSCDARPDSSAPNPEITAGSAIVVRGLGCEIDGLVLRPVSAKVTLKGWVEKRSGERVQFSGSPQFIAQPSLYVAPGLLAFFSL